MKKTLNRMIATLRATLNAEGRKERADRFVAWLAGANHERSMNG